MTKPPETRLDAAGVHNRVLQAASRRIDQLEGELADLLVPLLERAGARAAASFQRQATDHLTAAAPGVTSASTMIAVKPRPEEASAIAPANGLDASTLHVTLAYLGEVEGSLDPVAEALRPVAASHAPLSGVVGGVGVFAPNEDGVAPAIALPDVPGLVELRVAATEALAAAGIDYSRLHGFAAHLTLDYFDVADDGPGFDGELPLGAPLHFDSLLLVRGDVEVVEMPLVGRPPLTAASDPIPGATRAVDDAESELRRALTGGDQAQIRAAKQTLRDARSRLYDVVRGPQWSAPAPDELLDVDALVRSLRTKTDPVRQALLEATMTPALKAAGLSFDLSNPLAAKVLAQSGSQIKSIADTTQLNVMRIIGASHTQGLSIPDTAKAIQAGMKDAAPTRARLIARTELAGAVNGGSLAAMRIVSDATGDRYEKRWLTAPGATFPRHELYEGLDGQTVGLEDAFDVGGDALMFPGDPDGSPEEVCNCFPAETLVEMPRLRAAMRRWYDGDLVRVRLASGDVLAATPNHPVLRSDGQWIPLREVEEGDHLVSARLAWDDAGAPDPERPPAEIGETYRLARVAGDAERVALRPPDLHGDGADGEVDVVALDGSLLLDLEAATDEEVAEFGLALASGARARTSRGDGAMAVFDGWGDHFAWSAAYGVSPASESATLLVAYPLHPKSVRVGAAPDGQSHLIEAAGDGAPARADLFADREDAVAALVTLAEVVKVETEPFHGYVYNLDTGLGWYTASTIACRNCRCTVVYDTPSGEQEVSDGETPDAGGADTSSGSSDAAMVAEQMAAGAAEREPQTTTDLSAVARQAGGRMAGLEFAVKTRASLERKISSDMADAVKAGERPSVAEVAGTINDALRYTMTFPESSYARGVQNAIKRLGKAGYEPVKVKNYWGNADYQGINAIFAKGGHRLELQFHTPRTFELKTELHPQYEAFRTSSDPIERERLWAEMASEQEKNDVPPDALSIGQKVTHEAPPGAAFAPPSGG